MNSIKPRFDTPLPGWFAATPVAGAAAALYGMGVRVRNRGYDRQPGRCVRVRPPVISIGGIRAGGTGKTPAAMLLVPLLQELGYTVGLLSRGYRRTSRVPLIVPPGEPADWERTGDEPAMIRAASPGVWLGIGADRSENAGVLDSRMGERAVLLLDDGFQHRRLHRDCDIVCLHTGVFDDRLLPQGYRREPVGALARADVFFLIGSGRHDDRIASVTERLSCLYPETPLFVLYHEMVCWVNALSGRESTNLPLSSPVALCGIARPERFFDLLERQGVEPGKRMIFPDHYRYRDYDIAALRKLYSQGLITTEKDAVRLSQLDNIPDERLWYPKVRLRFSENSSLNRFNHYINAVLKQHPAVV